ncbi:MAG: aquaporin [Bauldia sp.]
MNKYVAELLGTATLVLIGCGSVVLGGYGSAFPVGMLPVAFAFGLAIVAMAYAIGPISGCHINPAVTVSMFVAGRMKGSDAVGYIIAQLIGGILGALIIVLIVTGKGGGYDIAANGLGQNGWGAGYQGGYSTTSAIIAELVATFLFTGVILWVTAATANAALAGLAIGLTLTMIHIVFIQVTGVSVNPARSLGPAVFVGGKALAQLWLFIIVPPIGGAIAGWLFRATR